MSPNRGQVTHEVALMLVRKYLACLKDYPYRIEGEQGLARCVERCAVSVEHAEATLQEFKDDCPTPKYIEEQADRLKKHFVRPEPTQEEKWRAEGYSKEYGFGVGSNFTSVYQEIMSRPYSAGAPATHELMWQAIKSKLKVQNFRDVPWGQIYQAQQELGFPLNPYEQDQLERYLTLPENKTHPQRVAASASMPPAFVQEPPRKFCEHCNSTGRTEEGSYCTCATGRDLARVEAPKEISDANEDWDNLPASPL